MNHTKKRTYITGLTIGLLAAFLPHVAYSQTGQSTVSSSGQTGGVTALEVGTVNINSSKDPMHEKISGAMISYLRTNSEIINKSEGSANIAYYDSTSINNAGGNQNKIYTFFTGDDEDLPNFAAKCHIDSDISGNATVYAMYGSKATRSDEIDVGEGVVTDANEPIFKAVCLGLNMSLKELSGRDNSRLKIYDYLDNGNGFIAIILVPSGLFSSEATEAKDFWKTAIVSYYVNPLELKADSPEAVDAAYQLADTGEEAHFSQSNSNDIFVDGNPDGPFTKNVQDDFGGQIEKMQTEWELFLAGKTIVIGSQRVAVLNGTEYSPLIDIYKVEDISKPDFWHHIRDEESVMKQMNCLGWRFAIERGYATGADAPSNTKCLQ